MQKEKKFFLSFLFVCIRAHSWLDFFFQPIISQLNQMPLHKLTVKFFVANDTFAPAEFVPVFHRWIQTQSFADHLLIDVADYAHVPAGPGSLLVASEANIHMDRSDNRLGLLYVRKLPIAGAKSFAETFPAIFKYALAAALKMEQDEILAGRLKFNTSEIAVGFNDRLLAPNLPETIAEYHPQVSAFAAKLFPAQAVTVQPSSHSPQELIDLRIKTSDSPSIAMLIDRASGKAVGTERRNPR